jgi:hypothetical protein
LSQPKRPESGFGLVSLIILVAIGFLAYFAWQYASKPSSTGSNSGPNLTAPIDQAKDSVRSLEQKNSSNNY